MIPELKAFIALDIKTEKERFDYLKNQVVWAINHRGLVPDDGIFENLRDAIEICDTARVTDKLAAIKALLPPQPSTIFHDCEYCRLVAELHKIIDEDQKDDEKRASKRNNKSD